MTEIRPIRESEAETFLDLLCGVFDLDYPRAHSIFFAEPLFDLNRKWALLENGQIVSILTTVPLIFGWGRAVGIAGVATAKDRQGAGLGRNLLETVAARCEDAGEGAVLLFARDTRLYESVGFEVLDEVVRGPINGRPEEEVPPGMEFGAIRTMYDAWAEGSPNRLRRDDLRWNYWKWNLRICTPFLGGYLCFEGGVVREVVLPAPATDWELPIETEWLGLSTMANHLGADLGPTKVELFLMGRRMPAMPEFFMTDQF